MAALETELATYQHLLPQLIGQHEGKFVLIFDSALEGVFDSYPDALAVGYDKFGVKPFLVKQVSGIEKIAHFTRDIVLACPT